MSAVTLMKASALGCPSRLPLLPFPMTNIMESDRHETCRQPVSSLSTHIVVVKCQLTHGYIVYLFFFRINHHAWPHSLHQFAQSPLQKEMKNVYNMAKI